MIAVSVENELVRRECNADLVITTSTNTLINLPFCTERAVTARSVRSSDQSGWFISPELSAYV